MNLILQAIKALLRNNRSDWNQNDPTKADYVKNRPFWTDDPKETVVFDGTVEIGEDGWNAGDFPIWISVGTKYKVTFNGTVYEAVGAVDETNLHYIGNLNLYNGGSTPELDNGMPFVIGQTLEGSELCWVATNAGGGMYDLKIEAPGSGEVHKIPEKYLPDGIGGGFTTVRFADFYDEEAEKDCVTCSYTFEEVRDMSVTPNPKLYQLADAVGNEFGFCTMYARCTKIEDVEYIVLIDISLNTKQMHLFGNNGVYLYSEVFEGKMFDIDEAIEYGTITWGVSE